MSDIRYYIEQGRLRFGHVPEGCRDATRDEIDAYFNRPRNPSLEEFKRREFAKDTDAEPRPLVDDDLGWSAEW